MRPIRAPLRFVQEWWRRCFSAVRPARPGGHPRRPSLRLALELLEGRLNPSPSTVYVNPAFTGPAGSDPDGSGPATAVGTDAFATLQPGIDAVTPGGTVKVAAGSYAGGLTIAKSVSVLGSGSGSAIVAGSGSGTGVAITAPAVELSGLSVRNFATGLSAGSGTAYLALTDLGLSGNAFGGSITGVAAVLFSGGAADDALFVTPRRFARQGDNPLDYSGLGALTVDGGGGSNRLTVLLNDISTADKVWLNGGGIARDTAHFLLYYRDTGGTFGGGVNLVLGDGPETAVVQGQLAGAPTTVYGQGGDDAFDVAVTPTSAYAGLTLDGGPGNDSLAVFKQSSGGALQNVFTLLGQGQEVATFPGGGLSRVGYQNVEQLLNTQPTTYLFAPQQSFAAGMFPRSVAVGDFNGDGKPDLAAANQNNDTVSVLLNTTATGAAVPAFAPQATFAIPTGSSPQSLAVADFNGDGKPDLVTGNFSDGPSFGPDRNKTVSVLLNTTAPGAKTPSFAPQVTFAVGTGPIFVTVGDLNADGKPDLIVADSPDGTVSVLLNTTAAGASVPSFAPRQSFATGGTPISVAVGDVNGDGKPDLVVGSGGGEGVSVLLNTTAPGATAAAFAPQQTFAALGAQGSVALADVNGDGKPDIVTANFGDFNASSDAVGVLLNTTARGAAAASFAPQQAFPAGGNFPNAVAAADVSGDGKPDLLLANEFSHNVSVLLNTTAPGANAPAFLVQPPSPTGSDVFAVVVVADVNGDGKPDLVTGNFDGTVSVLLNYRV